METTPSEEMNVPLEVEKYFSSNEWSEMPEYERTRSKNIFENYRMLLSLGFKADKPDFVKRHEEKIDEEKKKKLLSSKPFRLNEGASTSSGVVSSVGHIRQRIYVERSNKNKNSESDVGKSLEKPILKVVPQKPRPVKETPSTLSVILDIEKYFTSSEWAAMSMSERAHARAVLHNYSIQTSFKNHVETPSFIVAYNKRKDEEDEIVFKVPAVPPMPKPRTNKPTGTNSSVSSKNSNDCSKAKRVPKSTKNSQQSTSVKKMAPSEGSKPPGEKKNNTRSGKTKGRNSKSQAKNEMSAPKKEIVYSVHDVMGSMFDQFRSLKFEETDDLCFTQEEKMTSIICYGASLSAFPTEENAMKQREETSIEKQKEDELKQKKKKKKKKQTAASSLPQTIDRPKPEDKRVEGNTSKEIAPRYPKRNVPLKSYAEPEDINLDDFIFCDQCGREWYKECEIHGPLIAIPDLPVDRKRFGQSSAIRTTPRILGVGQSKILNAGNGVWTRDMISKHVRFGPYAGTLGKGNPRDPNYAWQLRETLIGMNFVDASDGRKSNWMRYVNCARNLNEVNLVAFQFKGSIYYRTFRLISPHEELFVYYGNHFGRELGIDVKNFRNPNQPKEKDVRFYCANCNTAFVSPLYLETHEIKCRSKKRLAQVEPNNLWKDYCTNELVFTCNQCHHQNDDESMIKRHMLEEHCKTRLHICVVCNVEFENGSQLQDHVKLHMDDGKWTCPEPCGEMFGRKTDLMSHLKSHGKMAPKCFRCNVCDGRFLLSAHLDDHLLIHTNEKPFECAQCGNAFTREGSLTRHMQQVHDDGDRKLFACSECTKVYKSRQSLKSHMNSEHTNSQPFRCTVCDKGYKCNYDLQQHMRTHTGERPFICDICDSAFTVRSHLKTHMRTHTGERPFTCDICQAAFTQKSHLETHMLIHSGETPFACEFCDYRCNRSSNLKSHVNRRHKDIN